MSDHTADLPESPPEPVCQPQLETDRLLLRPFAMDDASVVQELLQCREIAAHTRSIEHPYPAGGAEKWIAGHQELWNEGKAAVFAICEKTDADVPRGAIGLELNSPDENAELGYWVGQPYWGRGYCTEAAYLIVRFGFEHFGLHKIHAHHMTRNPASGRVLEKIGMRREGELRRHIKKWGQFEDVVFYGLLASELDQTQGPD